ncbi:phage portal protein, HK97 family [Phocoenobacter uteri]|uniref:Phage portal protein, HK97 family n=1 Tax=Phocoenobacter uteri TaxID=146806 RepID=A0A379C9H4_9PAST|nr:phage portal protein [Phocoenobacter uteri]MDG6880955.1 phage portal protein [Phocoenobacter uteri]MDG6882799.1 phage portal protein [Phocoenobacter uteri]SUB58970.1 phage portal protein, HK97 family [Phocoenobacter uteri]
MIFDQLFNSRSEPLENPKVSLSAENALDEIFGSSGATTQVTAETSMKLAAVYSCVYVLSSSIAQLPLHVLRRKGKDVEAARDHPLFYLLHDEPNQWQTSYKMREYNQSAVLLNGNAYLNIKRKSNGEITEIETLEADSVQLLKNNNRYFYAYYGENARAIPPEDIIHIKSLGPSIKTGKSVIQQHAETIGLGIDSKAFASSFFGSNARPSGIVSMKTALNSNAWDRFKEMWKKASLDLQGKENKTILLPAELDYKALTVSPVDTELLSMMKLNRSEIAGIFNVPAHMINDLERATFSNISEQTIQFIRYSLMPWIVNWEQEINRKVFTKAERKAGYYVKFNLGGIMRGTAKERAEFYHYAITDGWMSRNEVRAFEDLNPVDGLDSFLVSVNAAQPVPDSKEIEEEKDNG